MAIRKASNLHISFMGKQIEGRNGMIYFEEVVHSTESDYKRFQNNHEDSLLPLSSCGSTGLSELDHSGGLGRLESLVLLGCNQVFVVK